MFTRDLFQNVSLLTVGWRTWVKFVFSSGHYPHFTAYCIVFCGLLFVRFVRLSVRSGSFPNIPLKTLLHYVFLYSWLLSFLFLEGSAFNQADVLTVFSARWRHYPASLRWWAHTVRVFRSGSRNPCLRVICRACDSYHQHIAYVCTHFP